MSVSYVRYCYIILLTPVDHIADVGVPLCHRSEVVWDKEVGNRGGVFHPSELVLLQWPHILHTDAVIVTRPENNHNLSLDKTQHVQIEVKQKVSQGHREILFLTIRVHTSLL